ncbi:MAG TPA: hypothetical protein VGF94_13255 [Kofleriaceae bacterium]|jgi:hypothetical protein
MTDAARPPDRPPVPRPGRSVGTLVALVFAGVVCAGYGAMAYTQRELGEPAHDEIPASVRTSPGGYRSYHFWHTGYHGGK